MGLTSTFSTPAVCSRIFHSRIFSRPNSTGFALYKYCTHAFSVLRNDGRQVLETEPSTWNLNEATAAVGMRASAAAQTDGTDGCVDISRLGVNNTTWGGTGRTGDGRRRSPLCSRVGNNRPTTDGRRSLFKTMLINATFIPVLYTPPSLFAIKRRPQFVRLLTRLFIITGTRITMYIMSLSYTTLTIQQLRIRQTQKTQYRKWKKLPTTTSPQLHTHLNGPSSSVKTVR